MLSEPRIVERAPQPYLGIAAEIVGGDFRAAADRLPKALFAFLAARGVTASSAPFQRLKLIGQAGRFEIEWGVATPFQVAGEGEVVGAVLPAGRYATLTMTGGFDQLGAAHEALQTWAAEQDLPTDARETPQGRRFGCLIETYVTDPSRTPRENWVTEIEIRLEARGP